MAFEVSIIEFLQKASCKFLDYLMLILTTLGDEIFVVLVIIAVYLCVNKKLGYKFLSVYLLGAVVVNVIKPLVARPRPFDKYPNTVKSIGKKTDGYSFPSGHSNSISSLSTLLVLNVKNFRKLFIVIGSIITAIVMFTRLYLGQHYLTDVIVGAIIGVLSVILFSFLFDLLKDREELLVFGIVPVCVILMTVFLIIDGANANATLFKAMSVWSAISIGYYVDKKKFNFNSSHVSVKNTVIKLLIAYLGATIFALLLYKVLPFFDALNALICYFMLGIFVSLLAPLLFRALKLEKKQEIKNQNETDIQPNAEHSSVE